MHLRTDQDLLRDFIAGDQEAYALLVARHAGLVRCACRRQAPAADRDDCLQAVFLVLVRRPRAAARAPALEAWLLRVAWYVCQRARRGQRRRRQAETAAVHANRGGDGTPPEALDHLDDCLAKLPERQRLAVGLHYLGDKSAEEVARVLGVSRDNAYQLVSRGVAGLRALMSRRGIILGETALVLLLVNEAKAASAANARTTLTMPWAGSPTAHSLDLAQRSSLTMTLAALAPAGIAAACLLPVAVAILALTGESAPPPASVPAPVVATTPAPATGLDTPIDIACDNAPIEKVFDYARRRSGMNLILDRRLVDQRQILVSMQVHQVSVREVLARLATLSGGVVQSVAGAHFLCTPDRRHETRPRVELAGMSEEQRKRLGVPPGIRMDVTNGSLDTILPWLQRKGGTNIRPLLDPRGLRPITLTVTDMTVADALYWVAVQSDAAIVWDHQVLALVPYETNGVPRLDPGRCDWTGVERIPGLERRLAQEISLDVRDRDLDQVLTWIGRRAGVQVSLMPDFTAPAKPVSLRMDKMRVDNVLYWIADQVGGTVTVSGDSVLLVVNPAHS